MASVSTRTNCMSRALAERYACSNVLVQASCVALVNKLSTSQMEFRRAAGSLIGCAWTNM